MKLDCKLKIFSNCAHLQQIYVGFNKLYLKNYINLEIDTRSYSHESVLPILKVVLNKKYSVYYDTYDGYNYSDKSIEESMEIFESYLKDSDYYFKRSCNPQLNKMIKHHEKIYPLGLNYGVDAQPAESSIQKVLKIGLKAKCGYIMRNFKNSKCIRYFQNKENSIIDQQAIECIPKLNYDPTILFIARLWDPDMAENPSMKSEWDAINTVRIECVKMLRTEFKGSFKGGIVEDAFSSRKCKEIVLPSLATRRDNFINSMQKSDICIATTGLHNSIGWKFAEYVASSKAIVTEPLQCELPGNFDKNENFVEFINPTECVESVYRLIKNHKLRFKMMRANYYYYNNFVRPDNMILNSLYKVLDNEISNSKYD